MPFHQAPNLATTDTPTPAGGLCEAYFVSMPKSAITAKAVIQKITINEIINEAINARIKNSIKTGCRSFSDFLQSS